MKTIIITGCSWGCGEWNHGDIAHGGLAEYLTQDGYNVVNLSEPGSGPIHLINPLNEFPVVDSQQYRQFIIGLVLDGLALFMSILCLVINYYSNKEYKAKEWGIDDNESKINEPSNLLLHWRAFKDKVCIKVQYE